MSTRRTTPMAAIDARTAAPLSVGDVRTQLVIAAHHPDAVRRPPPRIGAVAADRFVQTLTWNVFRTLELLQPAFWLRRFHARLTGTVHCRAPQIAAVALWPVLPMPPAHVLASGRADVSAEVVIETEHALWALVSSDDRLGDLRVAARSRAAMRDCWIGTLSGSARQPFGASAADSITWADLAMILRECRDSDLLSSIERSLADNALRWLMRVGISAHERRIG